MAEVQMRLMMKHRQPDAFPILPAPHPHAFDAAVKADPPLHWPATPTADNGCSTVSVVWVRCSSGNGRDFTREDAAR